MKTIKNTFLRIAFCTSLLVLAVGCDKDNPLGVLDVCGSDSWTESVQTELTAWNTALSNYASAPTAENCNTFKTTGKAYLDALEDVKPCVGAANQQAFDQVIAEAKVDLDETDCTDL